MKKILFTLLTWAFVCLGVQLQAKPGNEKPKRYGSWEEQIASYLSYPSELQQKMCGSVVVIQFRVNPDSRLAHLKVFSNDDRLNFSLIKQLTGKKVSVSDEEFNKLHLVRLRFTPAKD